MKKGEKIPGLVGWAFHGDPAKIEGLEVVAAGKTPTGEAESHYEATIYPGPKGTTGVRTVRTSACSRLLRTFWRGGARKDRRRVARSIAKGATINPNMNSTKRMTEKAM